MINDLRYAVRMLRKSPGFTVVAVFTLALGIGANTAIFAVISAVLFRPLPYKEPAQLVLVNQIGSVLGQYPWAHPRFEFLRTHNQVFDQMGTFRSYGRKILTGPDGSEAVEAESASASYFTVLRVEAVIGRTFLAAEDVKASAEPVVLIGHALWQQRFGADPHLIGRTITLDRVARIVIGVLPQGFQGQSGSAQVWIPWALSPERLNAPYGQLYKIVARLKKGVTQVQAQAQMNLLAREAERVTPDGASFGKLSIQVASLSESKVEPSVRHSLLVLLGAVGFVLLIACGNISQLLLARGVVRQREFAIRLAVGARSKDLGRQLLTETSLLVLFGAAGGVLFAYWGIELLATVKPAAGLVIDASGFQTYSDALNRPIEIDFGILVFTFAVSSLTTLMVGLVPTLQALRVDVNCALKSGGLATPMGSWKRLSAGNLLVSAEIGLTLILLIAAGLMIHSFARLLSVPLGFDPQNLLILNLESPELESPEHRLPQPFYEQMIDRLEGLPGVESAAVSYAAPPLGLALNGIVVRENPAQGYLTVGLQIASPGYLKTMGIRTIKGRTFANGERAVALVNETAARRFWPGKDPIGSYIRTTAALDSSTWLEIVGVVEDVRYGHVQNLVNPDVYVPLALPTHSSPSIVAVRTSIDPVGLIAAIRREALAGSRDLAISDVNTMDQRLRAMTSRTRFNTLLLVLFAVMALLLAVAGVYGVISYSVSQRTQEFGVRIAMGADQLDVLTLILGQGLSLAAIGVTIGLTGASVVTRLLRSMLFGLAPNDPAMFTGAALLLMVVALLACYVPARRATQIDPITALRHE